MNAFVPEKSVRVSLKIDACVLSRMLCALACVRIVKGESGAVHHFVNVL